MYATQKEVNVLTIKRRIVVIDDDEMYCRSITRTLKDENTEVTYFTDPLRALEALEYDVIDILITDYLMPHYNGIELMKKIHVFHPNLIVILITGVNDFNVAVSAVNEGLIFRLLTKPFDNGELIHAVDDAYQKLLDNRMYEKFKDWSFATLGSAYYDDVVEQIHQNTIDGLLHLMKAKDHELYEHSLRIGEMSIRLAKYISYSPSDLENLYEAALFHDIGKLAIKDNILDKPGKLDVTEYDQVKRHPSVGAEVLKKLGINKKVQLYVFQHHEHVAGTGYPNGLKADEIELAAKIIAVVDAYDALRSKRSYKDSMDLEDSMNILRQMGGKIFDSQLIECLYKMLCEEEVICVSDFKPRSKAK